MQPLDEPNPLLRQRWSRGQYSLRWGMPYALKLHPDWRCTATARIDVDVVRPGAGRLELRYVVTGAIDGLQLPARTAPVRTDELWKHTCFEAFVRGAAGEDYCEFNFAPSTQWAAYRFTGYRDGMKPIGEIDAPLIEVRSTREHFEMDVSLDLGRAAELPKDAPWRVGVSAVIEETGGGKSYWALAHPAGKADFHHADSFVLNLLTAERT